MAAAYDIYDLGDAHICGAGAEHKADPYGAGNESPIPNPSGSGRSGEPIPTPGGLPARYPDYLKPIPINTRDIEAELRSYLKAEEPHLKRILYSTWNADREAVKYQEIRNAIRDGEFSEGFLEMFNQSYAEMVNEELAPAWRAAMAESAAYMGDTIQTKFGTMPRFREASERIGNWIDARGGELAVDLTSEQHKSLRATLRYYTTERPTSANELGRIIRTQVGLTSRQAGAVTKYREGLLAAGELGAQEIEHRVQNYAGRLHRIRAERIARTELSFAFNQGALEQMRQVTDPDGVLEGETIIKRWWAADDERTCPHCGPLHQTVVGMEETFPGATRRLPNVITCPAHPSCRCTIIYELLEDERE